MEKLPVTSYVRLVDIWLIVGQLIPFIEVIQLQFEESLKSNFPKKVVLFTIVESYNDDGTINHHGFERNVNEKNKTSLFETRKKEKGHGINEKTEWKIPKFIKLFKEMDIGQIAKIIGNQI